MDLEALFIDSLLPKAIFGTIEAEAKQNHIPILQKPSAIFLANLIKAKNPTSVLEIGTGIGYSGSIILSNCKANLVTTEFNIGSLKRAKHYFDLYGFNHRVTTILGDESEIIPLLKQKFDFIFLDGAKTRYIHHLPYLKKLLNPNAILLADNILFNGTVSGKNTNIGTKQSIVDSLKRFLTTICADSDFTTSIINVGDGMSFSILKESK